MTSGLTTQVVLMQGIIQSGYSGWSSVQPVACITAPCYFQEPVSNSFDQSFWHITMQIWGQSLSGAQLFLQLGSRMWACCVLQILAKAPPTSPLPTKAVFRYAPESDTAVAQDVCLHGGFLELATVSVYINGTFTW